MVIDKKQLMYFTNKDGRREHICADYTNKVRRARSRTELVRLWLCEPTWALSCRYPSRELLDKYFDAESVRAAGVYIGQELDLIVTGQIYVFIGCRGTVRARFSPHDACFPMIYVAGDSDLKLIIDGVSSPIEVFDEAKVDVRTRNMGKATVYRYGKGEITCSNDVTIKDKNGTEQ